MIYDDKHEDLRVGIDVAVQAWLTAHGVSNEVQSDLNYSQFDDEVTGLLNDPIKITESVKQ